MTKECYKKEVLEVAKNVLKIVAESNSKEIKNNEKLMIEFARHGENYFKDNKVKLMIVGRASGKTEKPHLNVTEYDSGKCSINEKKIETCFNEYYYEMEPLRWIHKKEDGKRYIDSKPFFGFSKKVYLKLTGAIDEPEWYKNICYTNLCKIISSEEAGNPSESLKKNQLKNGMLKMLEIEIAYYQPTHILVLDSASEDHSWTSKEFKDELKDYVSCQNSSIKICFSDRPEFRGYEELKRKVIMQFRAKI